MKTQLFAFLSFAVFAAFGTTTNKVLMVDEQGNINEPAALATTADMAANKAALITAEEKAAAAEKAAKAGTNLVSDIVADIGRNELVVYRYGYTDGFSAAVVLDPDAKLLSTDFEILDETDGAGRGAFTIKYALKNSSAVDTQPIIKWRNALNGGTDFEALPTAQIEPNTRLDETYTHAETGEVYPYVYRVKFYAPADDKGFFLVTLIADDAAGDGSVFDLPNGIKNGSTARVPFGESVLVIEGGIVVGVENAQ